MALNVGTYQPFMQNVFNAAGNALGDSSQSPQSQPAAQPSPQPSSQPAVSQAALTSQGITDDSGNVTQQRSPINQAAHIQQSQPQNQPLADNNIQATQAANAAYVQQNPNVFGNNTPTTTTPDFSSLQKGFQAATNSGQQVPQTMGTATAAVQSFSGGSENSTASQNATNFVNTNPDLQNIISQVEQFLSPTMTSPQLQDQINHLQTDQTTLAGLNTQLMNLKTIMNGTSDNIRSEIQAANGFATESQIAALATARNKTLLQQATLLQNQVTSAQETIKNDQTLLSEERQIATEQFNQNNAIVTQARDLYDKMQTAQKDGVDTIIKAVGVHGLVNGLMNADPTGTQLANTAQLLGMTTQELQQTADQEYYKNNLSQINAAGITSPYTVNSSGEVWNSQTGYAYTSPQDFQAKTGMSLDQANSQGMLTSLTSGLAQKNAMALEQQNLNLEKTQAEIQSAQASAGKSGTEASKAAYELNFEQSHGGMTPQQVYQSQKDENDRVESFQKDAGKYIADMDAKKMTWSAAWNELHSAYPEASTNALDKALNATRYRNQ